MVPETRGLITWKIRGLGFDMRLSGQVPGELGQALHKGELMAGRIEVVTVIYMTFRSLSLDKR